MKVKGTSILRVLRFVKIQVNIMPKAYRIRAFGIFYISFHIIIVLAKNDK